MPLPALWRRLSAATLICLLAACDTLSGGLGASGGALSHNTPPAADGRRSAEDGLVVGHRLMDEGEYELALKAYLRAASEQGMTVEVLASLGSANLALERLGQAESLLRRAIETDPTYVPALNNLGVTLMNEGKPGEARVFFQRAYALDSGATDSIRENLRLAIAQSESAVYGKGQSDEGYSIVGAGAGDTEIVTLSDL